MKFGFSDGWDIIVSSVLSKGMHVIVGWKLKFYLKEYLNGVK